MSQQEVKNKYQKLINMLKNAPEKVASLEDKRKTELDEIVQDFIGRRKEGLVVIKERFN